MINIKNLVKKIWMRTSPNTFAKLQSSRSSKNIEMSCLRDGRFDLAKKVEELTSHMVQKGPFKGMVLYPNLFSQHMSPKLLGSYEDELHPFFFRAREMDVDHVVNIGSAEGYYSIGACLLWRNAVVNSFDLVRKSRLVTAEHGRINGVSGRLKLGCRAEPESLEQIIKNAKIPFIISDCEGFEVQLLDPTRAPSLAKAIIVCEMHPMEVPEVETILRSRFDTTHEVSVIYQRPKRVEDYNLTLEMLGLDKGEQEIAIDEFRGYTPWMVMMPFGQISNSVL
jgi:hypothetical protein